MDKLLGNELVINDFDTVNTNEHLSNCKIICLYFSGSYCPPCIKFTHVLS